MPGTILLDDLQSSVEDQLHQHVTDLLGQAQQAASAVVQPVQALGAGVAQAVQAPLIAAPSQQEVLGTLQQHVDNLTQAAQQPVQTAQAVQQALQAHVDSLTQAPQQAMQVLGQPNQSGGVLTQLGQTKDQVLGALNQHVEDLSQVAQQVPQGLQSLATPPPPAPSSTQPAALGGDQGLGGSTSAVTPVNQAQTSTAAPTGAIDSSSPSAFARSIAPYAQYAAQKLGIDPTWVAAMAGSESNYGKAAGNELFGVKALPGQPGTTMLTHEGEYGGTQMNQTFAAYDSPQAAVDAWVDLIKNHYPGAVNAQDLPTFIHGLRQGGYFTAAEPEYLGIVKGISDKIGGDVQAGLQAVGIAPKGPSVTTTPPVTTAQARAADLGYTDISQFGDRQLSADEAYAACGPAAAVRFAERFGRNPTLREATDLAKQVGWTSSGGMAGIASEQQLLKNMGVDTHVVAPDWDAIAKEAQTGNPVTISTPGHYYFADGYNSQTGAFHVGQSGLDLKGGSEWMTADQMQRLMGQAQGALFADNPNVPAKGASGVQQNAPITLGGPSVQPVQYVHGALQDAQGNTVADNGPTLIQSAQDVLGGAAGAVGGAVGGAASALGTAAQGALGTAQDINRIQPGTEALKAVTPVLGQAQQSASSAVNQVASDVQQAAQGVLGAAQDVNRLTPGTTAVNAAAPVLGAAASDVGAGAQQATQTLGGAASAAGSTVRQTADELGAQRDAFAQSPIGQRLMQAAIENAQAGPSLLPAGSVSLYQDIMQAKNDWLAQNNPLNNLPGAKPEPGHEQDLSAGGLIAGLTTGIAQQFTDPVMLSLLGPTSSLANVGKEAVAGIVGPRLADNLAPGAAKVLMAVADKFTSGAIVGGLQNAMFEAEKKEATPESVGMALVTGAGLGGVIDVGVGGVLPVVRRLGQVLIDQAPTIRTALSARQAGQADVNAALGGVPAAVARARGEAPAVTPVEPTAPAAVETPRTPIGEGGLGTPRYEYPTGSTPQVISDTLRTSAEQDSTGVAHLDQTVMGSLPSLPRQTLDNGKAAPAWQNGIAPHLDDLRHAQDVGMNQSQWYSKFAQAVAQVVGDQNVNEFRTLFGITSQQTPPTENLQYTLGLMRMAREFTANGTDFTPANIKQWIANNPRTTSLGTEGAKWKMNNDQFKKVAQLYTTGEVKVATNAKTSSYASNILSALMNRFDPNSTMDTWMAQIFNYKNPNRTASSDQAFQAMRTVVDHLAGETGQVPHQAQAAMWFAIKGAKDFAASRMASPTLKAMVKDFTNGRTTLRQVLDRAGSEGAYDNPTGTWEQVSKDLGVASELAKLQPHLDANAPRPAIADSSYLYYPGKGTKLAGAEKIGGAAPRVSGVVPETTAYRAAAAERQAAVAETALPQSVRDTLRYDPETRQFGELRGIPHEVQGDQIMVPGGNIDTLRYVAARVHDAAGSEAVPATLYTYRPESPETVGWQLTDVPAGAKQQLLDDLKASGVGHQELNDGTIGVNALPVRSVEHENAIADAAQRAGATVEELRGHVEEASPGQSAVALDRYGARYGTGDIGGVSEPGRGVANAAGFRATEPIGRFFTPTAAATEAGPGAAAAGRGIRGPTDVGGFRAPVTPDDLNVRSISQAEARQLVGPAYDPSGRTTVRSAGEVPQNLAEVQARNPNVEIQAADSNRGITLSMIRTPAEQQRGGLATAAMRDLIAYADSVGKPIALTPERVGAGMSKKALTDWYSQFGFVSNKGRAGDQTFRETMIRQPIDQGGVRPDLNVRSISQAEARQMVGPAYDPSTRTTTRPPEEGEPGEPTGIPGVTRRTVQGAEPPATPAGTNLSDVHSNPHLLNEAGPGETPMTMDERLAHQDMLEQRYQANQDRLAAIDEQLRNPNAKPERPPWGAGWTNDQLVSIAKAHDQSAYEPLWWEKAGLESGSGEVRENVGEGGFRNPNATREPTPQELRQERNQLAVDQRDLEAAGEQQATAPDNARFVRRQQSAAALPFAGGEESAPHGPYATEQASSGPGSLAEDIVTQNGRKSYGDPLTGDGLKEAPGEVVGTKGGITGTGISDIEAEAVRPGPPSEATLRRMPNLDAMLKGEMPEVRAQIQRAAEDNPELFDAYRQGRISHDSLVTDLATKVGMTREQWLKTPVGKGFNQDEMVALQAAAIDAQARSEQMAKDIAARGGVDALSPEQVAYGLNELIDNTRLLTVARGGRSTAGRTLNALKIRLDATMARGINASNERIGATRLANQAKAAVKRATQQLEQSKQLDAEQKTAVASARAQGAPKGIIDRIAEAYDQLDRYQAMTLHEKADDFNALKAQRDALAAKRQAAVREPSQELLSALQAELKAERDNFAKRKDTWETMAFWDSKANENVATKRNAFRGGLYIEQYRKSADLAAKSAEADAKRAFDLESRRQSVQSQKATTLLEAVGGAKPSRELLSAYVDAVNSDDPLAAGKFVKGLMTPGWWARAQTLRIAGLLSSTVTHMANMVGNVTQVPLELATHAVTVPIDWARAKATGGRRVAYMAELGPMLQSYGPGFAASMGDAVKILQSGISPADAVKLENIRPGIASGSGKVDAVLEGPLRALQAEDELFRGGAFAMQANRVATRYAYREGFRGEQLAGRTANIIKNLETYPDLYKEAHDAMLRMVFQEHRDWIPSPKGPVRGVVSQPLPFIKTPANITAQGMGLSPFGVAGSIAAVRARGALEASGKATGAQLDRATLLAEQRIARTAIGTAIFGMGVGLGAGTFSGGKSLLTGAYDPNEASTYPQGWREWSMVTQDPVSGNTYYVPLQNFGAAGAPLAMAAIVTDAAKRGHSLLDENEAQRAATSIGQYVLDNTFLQGLSDTVNVLHDPSRYANKFLESLVSSYGPFSALGRQVQRAYGVASRNPHDGLMGLVEAMESNYPGLSGNVPESLTAIGEPRTQGISGAAAFALPVRADILRDEPTLRALRDNDVRIPPAPKAVNVGNGWSVDLTPEEQDQLQRARGVAIRDWVARMQAMPAYQAAPAGEAGLGTRNLFLAKAVSNASQQADIDFYRSLPRSDIRAQSDGGRAVRRTVPTTYTVAGEEPAA